MTPGDDTTAGLVIEALDATEIEHQNYYLRIPCFIKTYFNTILVHYLLRILYILVILLFVSVKVIFYFLIHFNFVNPQLVRDFVHSPFLKLSPILKFDNFLGR